MSLAAIFVGVSFIYLCQIWSNLYWESAPVFRTVLGHCQHLEFSVNQVIPHISVTRLSTSRAGFRLLLGEAVWVASVTLCVSCFLTVIISGLLSSCFSRRRYTWQPATTASRLSSCYCSTVLMCTPRTRGKTVCVWESGLILLSLWEPMSVLTLVVRTLLHYEDILADPHYFKRLF